MSSAKHTALDARTKHKANVSAARKHFRDSGYTTVKEKSYFDYGHKERANIRANMKEDSNMHKWAGSKKHDVAAFKKRNNPFPENK